MEAARGPPDIDTMGYQAHADGMGILSRRVAALLLALAVLGGHPALCRASAGIPEGRMACCPPDASCPMHASPGTADDAAVSAARPAPDCCAASPSAPPDARAGSPARPLGVDLPAALSVAPAGPVTAARCVAPPAGTHAPPVRRHALLSVYLL